MYILETIEAKDPVLSALDAQRNWLQKRLVQKFCYSESFDSQSPKTHFFDSFPLLSLKINTCWIFQLNQAIDTTNISLKFVTFAYSILHRLGAMTQKLNDPGLSHFQHLKYCKYSNLDISVTIKDSD